MRIKRYTALFLAAALALALCACGADEGKDKEQDGGMTIAPAQLTEEEQNLADLLALGMESYHIFSFQAKGAKSLRFNVCELIDGDWAPVQDVGAMGMSAENGRVALTFGKLTDGVRLALQTEGELMSGQVKIDPADDVSAMTFATSTLDQSGAAIELDREIPLVLQTVTARNEVRMYPVDYFEMPRELAKSGYEHIYAITVTFSARELGSAPSSSEPPAEPSSAD